MFGVLGCVSDGRAGCQSYDDHAAPVPDVGRPCDAVAFPDAGRGGGAVSFSNAWRTAAPDRRLRHARSG